jgi:hypothetical protein
MFVQRIKEHDTNDSVDRAELMTYIQVMYSLALSLNSSRIFFSFLSQVFFYLFKKEKLKRRKKRKKKKKKKKTT